MTEGGDIGFRIYYKDSQGSIDLIPLARLDSHLVMEEGDILCESAGKCESIRLNAMFIIRIEWILCSIDTVEFDNTFSYLKPKKLRYHITVNPPSSKKNNV